MKKKRNKPYNPNSKFNPAYQARKIDKIQQDLEVHQRQIQAISRSHDIHIGHLANFARHDIKNAIQNMDSILSTTGPGEFDNSIIESLSTSLEIIRTTIDNFAKLVPYSTTGAFSLDVLLVALELLARVEVQKHEIEIAFDYRHDQPELIQLPFQAVLQMMNNLMINAVKSLDGVVEKKMLVTANIDQQELNIFIRDNGQIIEPVNSDRIFEYGYTTTGGSGIGLFHAQYLCTEFKGKISVDLQPEKPYTKTFIVSLPIASNNGKDGLNSR